MQIDTQQPREAEGLPCIVLANVARIIDGSTEVLGRRSGFDAGLRKVQAAITEALSSGAESVEVALTVGNSPFERFLAQHETIAAEAARVIAAELRCMIGGSAGMTDRVHYTDGGVLTSVGSAIAGIRAKAGDCPVAVLVPHEMRSVAAAPLRELILEYDRAEDVATIVAATVGMDNLPRISWLACRGRSIFARFFEDGSESPSDLSELRLIGRCILPPEAARCGIAKESNQSAAVSLSDVLNEELASGRRVIARKFARRESRRDSAAVARLSIAPIRAIPDLRTMAVCAAPV